jgi:hypothetical protein
MPKHRVLTPQGRSMSSPYTSSPFDKSSRLIGTASPPTRIDMRIDEDFAARPRLIQRSVGRSHFEVLDWTSRRITLQQRVVARTE